MDFDAEAAARFERLKQSPVHIGTMDLKIAAIALANGAIAEPGESRSPQIVWFLAGRVPQWEKWLSKRPASLGSVTG